MPAIKQKNYAHGQIYYADNSIESTRDTHSERDIFSGIFFRISFDVDHFIRLRTAFDR